MSFPTMRAVAVRFVAAIGFVAVGAGAEEQATYKVTIDHKAYYGHPLDDSHFVLCGKLTAIEIPSGSKVVRVDTESAACPVPPEALRRLYAGKLKGKLKLPKPKPTATPES